jgi:hypothetical protein
VRTVRLHAALPRDGRTLRVALFSQRRDDRLVEYGCAGAAAIHAMNSATVSGGRASAGLRVGRSSLSADHVPHWVAIAPGYTRHARTPWGLTSAPSACVNPVRANLEAQ